MGAADWGQEDVLHDTHRPHRLAPTQLSFRVFETEKSVNMRKRAAEAAREWQDLSLQGQGAVGSVENWQANAL